MRLVVVGDLHYSIYPLQRLRDMRDRFYVRLFESVQKTNPDVVIFIGDVSHSSREEEFAGVEQCARQAGIEKFYILNGNHDLWTMTPAQTTTYSDNPRASYFALYLDKQGQPTNAATADYHFIILDTSRQGSHVNASGFVPPTQLNWLAHEVEQVKTSLAPLFVFGHHPLHGLTKWAKMPNMNITNSNDMWRILATKKTGPNFYFCGHNHANDQAWRDNWLAVQTSAPLVSLNFRLVTIEDNAVEMKLVPMEGALEMARMSDILSFAQYNITRVYGRAAHMVERAEAYNGKGNTYRVILNSQV